MNLPEPQLAINRHPLTVSPDTPLLDVLAKMNQIHGGECTFFNKTEAKNKNLYSGQPSFMPHPGNYKVNNCALIVEEGKIRGIITERDVVKLVARGQNLAVPIANVMTKEVITLAESEFKDVFLALSLLRDNQIRHLPSIDDAENLVGVVTAETIREVLQPVNLLTMRRVADVMTTKVIHAPASSSVLNLAQLMADNCVSCVVIANSEANTKQAIPIGIVTERDIVQLQILGLQIEDIQAEKVMSQPLFCMNTEDSLWVAHLEMQRRLVRRLVVTGNQGQLVGIITQTNIMRALDPVEMYGVIETLQQVVEKQTIELIKANEKLQLQAEEVRADLEKEQELNSLKSQFISLVSHEFRNPLASIIGLIDLLENCQYKLAEEKKLQYMNCIFESANRMLEMVDHLLVIGKADGLKFQSNPVQINLLAFCQEILLEVELAEQEAHSLNFVYNFPPDLQIYIDEKALGHILTNLLSNAIKYSPSGSQVTLEIYVENKQIIFEVKDRGIGIPPQSQ